MNIVDKLDRFILEQADKPYVYFYTDKINSSVSKDLEKSFDASIDSSLKKKILTTFDKSFVQMTKSLRQLEHYEDLDLELEIMDTKKGYLEFNYIISFKFALDGADMDMYVKELELDLHEPEVGIFSSNNQRLEVIEFASDDGVKNTTKFIKKFFRNMSNVKIYKDEVDSEYLEYKVVVEFTDKVK